jgi:hypothetical protein
MALPAIFLAGLAAVALADVIVPVRAMTAPTIAEIFVEKDSIRVELEIGLSDLRAFANVMPDALYERLGSGKKPLEERVKVFLSRDWILSTEGAAPLAGRVLRIQPRRRIRRDEITGEPISTGKDPGQPVVFVELAYQLDARPRTLTIRPPTREGTGAVAASIGFVLYHAGLAVNDFRYLGREATVELDWSDPWYSRFRHRNLRRYFAAPLQAFLYVEPFEVRKEIVVRPMDLQQWIDLGLEGREIIPAGAQAEIKRRIAQFFLPRSPVTVDGKRLEPILDRVHFIRRSLRWTSVVDPPEDLPLVSAMVGVIFVYPIKKLPREVTMDWGLFSARIPAVSAMATDEAGGMPYTLTSDDPVLRWQNFLRNPRSLALKAIQPPASARRVTIPLLGAACIVVGVLVLIAAWRAVRSGRRISRRLAAVALAVVAAGVFAWPYARVSTHVPFLPAPAITPPEAKQVLGGLLFNVYRAFDRRDENLVYDRLARSITGDLLSKVYLDTRRSMELEGQGGARVKVDQVDILDASPEGSSGPRGFTYRCHWNVAGSVGHWGHTHRRVNRYDAVLTVAVMEGSWKIAAIDLREEERVVSGRRQ